jgi:calcineurin-like phosphoesterase
MTGPYESVIGMEVDGSIRRMLTGLNTQLAPASHDVRLAGVIVDIESSTGHARSIERLMLPFDSRQVNEHTSNEEGNE